MRKLIFVLMLPLFVLADSPIIGGPEGPKFIAPLLMKEVTAPSNPPLGYQRVYIKSSDGKVYRKDSSGNEVLVETDVTDIEADIAAIQTDITNIGLDIVAIQDDVGDLQTNVGILESAVDALEANAIYSLSGDVSATGPGAATATISNLALSKLAALTANRAVVTDGSGVLSAATTTDTEIGFVNGVTSSLCGIDQACTQTNKTFTLPTIDTLLMPGQASAPSNPSAGQFKIWVDETTGKPKIVNSAGTVSALGGGGGSSGINILAEYNNKAEEGTTYWSETGGGSLGTTTTAANVGNGLASFSFDASTSGDYVASDVRVIPAGLYGASCLAEIYYQGFDSNVTLQVYDGTNVIASETLTEATNYTKSQINFLCPTSGNLQLRIYASADAAIGYFDEVHLGSATNISVYDGAIDLGTESWAVIGASGTSSIKILRVGNRIFISGTVNITGAASSVVGLTIPTEYRTNTTAYPQLGGQVLDVGSISMLDAGTSTYPGSVHLTLSGQINFYAHLANSTNTVFNGTASNIPHVWANGDKVTLEASWIVPTWTAPLSTRVDPNFDTTGMVIPFAGSTCPAGTLVADGAAISRADYPTLFAKIGVTHGQGDGSTTFNKPDYRGRFLRGVDNMGVGAAGRDVHTRSAMNTGGNSSGVGSVQTDAFQGHWHNSRHSTGAGGSASYVPPTNSTISTSTNANTVLNPISDGTNGTPRTAAETVPHNAAVTYCIVTSGQRPVPVLVETSPVWYGYHDSTCAWTRNNTTQADPATDASCALVEDYNRNFGTVTSAGGANTLPGIVFTPTQTGPYEVCANFGSWGPAASLATLSFWLVNNAGTTIDALIRQTGGTSQEITRTGPLCGVQVVTSPHTSHTVKIQMATNNATNVISGGAGRAISWKVRKL